jgi:hypothetical protein
VESDGVLASVESSFAVCVLISGDAEPDVPAAPVVPAHPVTASAMLIAIPVSVTISFLFMVTSLSRIV